MGICNSAKAQKHPKTFPSQTNGVFKSQNTPKFDKKFNSHSTISNLKDEVILKNIGNIHGDAVQISNNSNCTIIIMDYSGGVAIQECTDCTIFIAPCAGSIIIRNSSRITMISASNQLRITNVESGTFLVYSNTSPAIESSKEISLGCFCFGYVELPEMFSKAELNVWQNCWSEYECYSKGITVSYCNKVNEVLEKFKLAMKDPDLCIDQFQAVPFTYGKSYDLWTRHSHMLMIFKEANVDTVELCKFLNLDELFKLNSYVIKTIIVEASNNRAIKNLENTLRKSSSLETQQKAEYLSSTSKIDQPVGGSKGALSNTMTMKEDYLVVWLVNDNDDFESTKEYIQNSLVISGIDLTNDDFSDLAEKMQDYIRVFFPNYFK